MNEAINIMRHESIFNPSEYPYPMHIIGAGATGSRVFAALIELGITNIKIYDPDLVESHNLANQIYTMEDIGLHKVAGCYAFAERKLGFKEGECPEELQFFTQKVSPTTIHENRLKGGIVFLLTDSTESRKEIMKAIVARAKDVTSEAQSVIPLLIIETRMGSTHGSVYSINPFDYQAYKDWLTTLVDDTNPDNVELSPCGTTLSVGTTASLIANYAVWQMMQFFVNPIGMQPKIDLFFKPTLTITSSNIGSTP